MVDEISSMGVVVSIGRSGTMSSVSTFSITGVPFLSTTAFSPELALVFSVFFVFDAPVDFLPVVFFRVEVVFLLVLAVFLVVVFVAGIFLIL
jgi:hypothetical protein